MRGPDPTPFVMAALAGLSSHAAALMDQPPFHATPEAIAARAVAIGKAAAAALAADFEDEAPESAEPPPRRRPAPLPRPGTGADRG